MKVELDKALKRKLALRTEPDDLSQEARDNLRILEVERGNAHDEKSAESPIDNALQSRQREIVITQMINRRREIVYSCHKDHKLCKFADEYKSFLESTSMDKYFELDVNGKNIRITGAYRTIQLEGNDGKERPHVMLYYDRLYGSTKVEIKVRHLAVNAVMDGKVATIAFSPDEKIYCPPLPQEQAKRILSALVEKATGAVPAGYPNFMKTHPKDDELPEEWLEPLKEIEIH